MTIEIIEEPASALAQYAQVPIAFNVSHVVDVVAAADEPGRFTLSERPVDTPYVKDYDVLDGEAPFQWATRFDVSHWGLYAAKQGGQRVGGAAVAFRTPGFPMLEDRHDLAVLWDIRVTPQARRQGVGSSLLGAVEAWARTRDCRQLKVETQNINVPASAFTRGMASSSARSDALPTLSCQMRSSSSGTKSSDTSGRSLLRRRNST
jgi:GNAT superfamily N-acetyltransferase